MKQSERGFTLIELLLVTGIVALITGAASVATAQVFTVTEHSNNHMTAARQVQNAGYWITRDALRAENVTVVDEPESMDFLVLTWTEWGYDEDTIYHEVVYFFQDLSDGVGELKRTHWSSAGINTETLVAKYICYEPGGENTTRAQVRRGEQMGGQSQTLALTVQVVASIGDNTESKEYKVWRRIEF